MMDRITSSQFDVIQSGFKVKVKVDSSSSDNPGVTIYGCNHKYSLTSIMGRLINHSTSCQREFPFIASINSCFYIQSHYLSSVLCFWNVFGQI